MSHASFINIKTRLGVNRVKPWNSVGINLGLDLRGPDIRPGFDNGHLIIEGHRGLRSSWKVKKGQGRVGRSFPISRLTFQVINVMGG